MKLFRQRNGIFSANSDKNLYLLRHIKCTDWENGRTFLSPYQEYFQYYFSSVEPGSVFYI